MNADYSLHHQLRTANKAFKLSEIVATTVNLMSRLTIPLLTPCYDGRRTTNKLKHQQAFNLGSSKSPHWTMRSGLQRIVSRDATPRNHPEKRKKALLSLLVFTMAILKVVLGRIKTVGRRRFQKCSIQILRYTH